MVWNYIFDETEITFDDQLLEQIQHKENNSLVEATLQNDENLCSAVDVSGSSLLHYAARYGNDGIIPYLIKSTNVNLQDKTGNTPLLLATKEHQTATIKVLLKCDADIYICDNDGNNPLQLTLKSGITKTELAKLFLHHISNDCSSDSTEIAKKLMKIDCPLYTAVLLKNVDVTTCMISEGCDIDAKDPEYEKTALHVAVDYLDSEHVKKLVFLGADVNAKNLFRRTPLTSFRELGGNSKLLSILETLIDGKTNITSCDNEGFMQMRYMLEYGFDKAVKIVLQSECNYIYETDEHKQTVVHYLAKNCNSGIAEVIKEIGNIKKFDLNARDKDGLTAMHYAMNSGNMHFVELLIESGANLNIANHNGVTPFLYCVDSTSEYTLKNRVECVKILLMNEAHPDIFLGHYFKIHNTKSMINRDYVLLEPCIAMLALWKTDGKSFNKDILGIIETHPKLKEYFDKCIEELDKLKNEVIYKSVTMFDVLVENDNVQDSKYYFTIAHGSTLRKLEKYNSVSIYYDILNNNLCDMLDSLDDMWWTELLFVIKHYHVLIVFYAIIIMGMIWVFFNSL